MSRIRNSLKKLYTLGITLLLCLGASWLAWFLLEPLFWGSLRIKSYSGIVSLAAGTGLTWYVVFEVWKFIVPGSRKKSFSEMKNEAIEQSNQKKEDPL
jgi:hypothetical protein